MATIGLGARRFHETCIGPGLAGFRDACDGLVQAVHGFGVSARHDEKVMVRASIHRRADFLQIVLARNHFLVAHVATPLRPHLVFQEAAGSPGIHQELDRAVHVQRIAVAGVGIDDYGDGYARADRACTLDHLGLG